MSKEPRLPPSPRSQPGGRTTSEHEAGPDHARDSSLESLKAPVAFQSNGEFDGSFAGVSRRKSEVHVRPWWRRREYFTEGWTDVAIWKAAVVEAMASMMLIYISAQFGMTISGYGTRQVAAYVGIFNTILLSVFIYASAPASGGHLNPFITWTTLWCGLCPAPRGVLYIIFQTLGGAIAGGLLRGSWGYERAAAHMGGGCFFTGDAISPGQVVLTEIMSSWIVIFLGFGTGLDPRQGLVFGPQLGPLLVGLGLGVVTSATSGIAEGYSGANMNPARCLALSAARGDFSYHWIWWIGPAVGGLLNALLYNFAPPYHAEKSTRNEARSLA